MNTAPPIFNSRTFFVGEELAPDFQVHEESIREQAPLLQIFKNPHVFNY